MFADPGENVMAQTSEVTIVRFDRAASRLAPYPSRMVEWRRAWQPLPGPVADVLCLEDRLGAPRIHSHFAVTLLRSPAFITAESSRGVNADRGQVLLMPARQLCALRAEGQAGAGPVTLLLDPSHAEALGTPDRPALVADPECAAQLAALIDRRTGAVGVIGYEAIPHSLLQRLFARANPLGYARSSGRSLAPVRRYLDEHLGEPIPTAVLAGMIGLTESHLIRAFHLEFGLPPHAYHLRLRLARAVELLSCGLTVATVAGECGFADQSHLGRKFKEVYGMTPAAWAAAATRAAHHPRPLLRKVC
jgi:AraC-like DNA-binding protein